MRRIGYQGEPGSFSFIAAQELIARERPAMKMDHRIDFVAFSSFDELFEAIHEGRLDGAVVAIENSLVGPIREGNVENYERIVRYGPLILREYVVHVTHNLIALPGVCLEDLRTVYSHPMALLQCERFIRQSNGFRAVAFDDTAGSVRKIIQEEDRSAGAIAGSLAASMYGANILIHDIGDSAKNFTRFFLLGTPGSFARGSHRKVGNKTSIVFGTKNRPGALAACLNCFATRGINLTNLHMRPIADKPWEYLFYIDFMGSVSSTGAADAIQDLEQDTEMLQILGCYES